MIPSSETGSPSSSSAALQAASSSFLSRTTTAMTFFFGPQQRFADLALRTGLGITFVLYVLNQKHLLPKPLAYVVSKLMFYPTLPITAGRRIGRWVTRMDETLVLGGCPFAMLDYPRTLKEDYEVSGVINMCKEWRGPTRRYKELGIEELYLPTVDHFEPSGEDLISALSFLQRHESKGSSVYVHCRAGHGRSGAVAFAWAMLKGYPKSTDDPEKINADLRKVRKIRPGLWKQPNLRALRDRLVRCEGSLVDPTDFQKKKKKEEETGGDGDGNDGDDEKETKKDL